MTQEGVQKWIRKHASIAHRSKFPHRSKWKVPEIWMTTGVQYVTGGTVHVGGIASDSISGSGGADVGPAFGLPPGVAKLKAEASHSHSNSVSNDFGHQDERVWAAQFMPVTFEFGSEEDVELSTKDDKRPEKVTRIDLDEVPDLKLRGIRGEEHLDKEERPTTPPPALIAWVVTEPSKLEDSNAKDPDGFVIDDSSYVDSIVSSDWDTYKKSSKWLADAERRREALELEPDATAGAER